jgi:hypothetical protein
LQGGFTALKGILAGGLIAALVLVAEDLWVFYQGGTSVTGWLLTKFPYAVEVAQGALALLSGSLVALATGSGPLGLLVVGIGGLVIAGNDLRNSWNPVMQWFGEQWDWLSDKVKNFVNWADTPLRLAASLFGVDMELKPSGPQGTAKTRAAYEGASFGSGVGALDRRGDMTTWGAGSGAARAVTNNQNRVDNSIKIGEVHVHEASSGEETWDRIQKAAREQTRNGQPGSR